MESAQQTSPEFFEKYAVCCYALCRMQAKAKHLVQNWLAKKPPKPLLVILGPTASGKTPLTVKLAQRFDGEIINADSRQIYRGLDIGSAPPSAEEMQAAPHHLVAAFSPNETISAAKYRRLAEENIQDIRKRGKLPILSGGHSLLISAIVENYQFAQKSDPQLRAKLENDYEEDSKKVWGALEERNPAAAKKIPAQNKHHLIRALEREMTQTKPAKGKRAYDCLLLGLYPVGYSQSSKLTSVQSLLSNGIHPVGYSLSHGVNPPREKLYENIDTRVDTMMEAGLLDEVKSLAKKYDRYSPALRGHGYRELLDYLAGEKTLEKAVEEIKRDTRNYAKRQMTWWRNCSFANEIIWI